MQYSETLLTIAELAVALAGFASLVSVIGRRQDERSRAIDSFRLQSMLEVALRYAALALVPLPFLQLAATSPMVWRLSSGLYLVSTVIYGVFRTRRARALEVVASERWLIISAAVLTSVASLINLANVFGLGGSDAFSLYLASLILGLGVTGLIFLSVAASVFRGERR